MEQFTCLNGECISLDQRWDAKMDCSDSSDEDIGNQITFDVNKYRKYHVPGNPEGTGPLQLGVYFEIHKIVEMNEPKVSKVYLLLAKQPNI